MATEHQPTATLSLKQGLLRGRTVTLSEKLGGGRYFSFQGIPYAQPPIGELRFKAPVAASSWKGVRDAFTEGPISVQKEYLSGSNKMIGNEDCLYLNVYVPDKQPLELFQLLPVMVWIHGGGFELGSGDTIFQGPEFFMRNGSVIMVTINYRIGPLGFMSLGTEKIPGNAGLKDQVLALKWVQENILRFRGDPDNVTIFGESAGGASVHYLLLSPSAKGLFHRAILQSGCALNGWANMDKNQNKKRSLRLAKALGCDSHDLDVVADFLQQVPAYTLTERKAEALEFKVGFMNFIFTPCIDGGVTDIFLPEEPTELMRAGNFTQVPIMVGATSLEGFIINMAAKDIPNYPEGINQDFSILITKNLLKGKSDEEQKNIIDKVKKFYFNDKSITEQNILQMYNLVSDVYFLIGIFEVVNNFLEVASTLPLYLYQFSFDGSLNTAKKMFSGGKPSVPGACHGDDINYLFKANFIPEPEPGSQEFIVIERMIDIWTNFAKNGNPTENMYVQWQPYTKANPTFLNISSTLNIEEDYFNDRIEFWNKILSNCVVFYKMLFYI